jgi:hypothetical protein
MIEFDSYFNSYQEERELIVKIAVQLFVAYRTQPGAINIYYDIPLSQKDSLDREINRAIIDKETGKVYSQAAMVFSNTDVSSHSAARLNDFLAYACLREASDFVEQMKKFRAP